MSELSIGDWLSKHTNFHSIERGTKGKTILGGRIIEYTQCAVANMQAPTQHEQVEPVLGPALQGVDSVQTLDEGSILLRAAWRLKKGQSALGI